MKISLVCEPEPPPTDLLPRSQEPWQWPTTSRRNYPSHGNLSENWKTFKEAFRIYLIASGLDEKNDSRKIAIFLNFIGEEALRVHETIKKETDTKLAEVLQTWQEYCNPKKNTLHSRFLFYSRNQKEGESFNSFHTDLKTLLMDCAFDDSDSMLRDRLVLGSNDKDIKTKL